MSLDATARMALASADAVEAPFFTAERVLPRIADTHRDSETRFVARSDEITNPSLKFLDKEMVKDVQH